MTVSVSPTTTRPTHHISLTDGTTTIGLILCDSNGTPSQLSIKQGGIPTTALKTQTGNTGYADFEMPYSPIVQTDWGGGRGEENFDNDAIRYSDSNNVDTTHGDIVLGPKVTTSSSSLIVGRHNIIYFEYKRQLYAVTTDTFELYINGYRGAALSNTGALSTLKTGLTLTENELAGCIAVIIGGPGAEEETNWRKIVSNTVGGVITVSGNWVIEHTTATEYVILGTDVWTLISSTGLTATITDVLVANNIVYFAQGASVNIRRMREYNNAGTWTREFVDDGTNKANYMCYDGTSKIWKALSVASTVSSAPSIVWAGSGGLVFGSEITCGDTSYRINKLITYGEYNAPFVLKDDSIGYISNNIYIPVPVPEMKATADNRNGKAALHQGVYLYLSLLNGLERYYDTKLDDMGPNRDEGLPFARQGNISRLAGYPGKFYAIVDTGQFDPDSINKLSSIMCYNNTGWHEIYRPASPGRIVGLYIQVMPGNTPDRIWFAAYPYTGASYTTLYRMPVIIESPRFNSDYRYGSTGWLESGWIFARLKDVQKFWKSVSLFTEGLSSGSAGCHVDLAFKVDDASSWTTVSTPFTVSPQQEINLSATNSISGRKLKYRLTLESGTNTLTPRVTAIVVNSVIRIPIKKRWSLNFLAEDAICNLHGEADTLTAAQLLTQLDTWANGSSTPLPLTLHSNYNVFDDKTVFIDPASVQPVQLDLELRAPQRKTKMVGSLGIFEA